MSAFVLTVTVPCFILSATLNSTAQINAALFFFSAPFFFFKEDSFQVVMLHFALISITFQLLNPLQQPIGTTHRRNCETSFKS